MKRLITKTSFILFRILLLTLGAVPLVSKGQIPLLNSNPGAAATVYIDFDGHEVSGTAWNWSGPIQAEPAQISTEAITEIFHRVAEDFRIFNINITTDSAVFENAIFYKRIRVIVTPTHQWYDPPVAGVAYVGSFNWGNNTPAWVFSSILSNQPKFIAEVISHEAGHSLGLQHQSTYNGNCELVNEYNEGQGTGETSWAPIMGSGYYRNVTTWNNGPSTVACNIWQNDIQVIAFGINNIGIRDDDHGDNLVNATPIILTGSKLNSYGLINISEDRDVFRLAVTVTSPLLISAVPLNVGSSNAGANLDLKLTLLNADGDTLYFDNPELSLDASIDTTLAPGTYFLVVEGTANANLPEYGSLGMFTLAGIAGITLPIHRFFLKGRKVNGMHELTWELNSDDPVPKIQIQVSQDGIVFTDIAEVQGLTRYFITKAYDNICYYRLMINSISNVVYYSNIVSIRKEELQKWLLHSQIIREKITLSSTQEAQYELFDINGSILQKGRIVNGVNYIYVQTLTPGLLFLRLHSNNEVITYKVIKS